MTSVFEEIRPGLSAEIELGFLQRRISEIEACEEENKRIIQERNAEITRLKALIAQQPLLRIEDIKPRRYSV